jgi:putative membrane protein
MNSSFWLTEWNWQPGIIIGVIVIQIAYLYAIGPLREKYHLAPAVKNSQVVLFLVGVYVIFFALFSPLDKLGDSYLFSAHMVQHLLITVIGPPLMVLGIPSWLVTPLLRWRWVVQAGKFLLNPMVTFSLFNAAFWIWHAPPLFVAAIYNKPLHLLEHVIFMGTALLYWWPVFSSLSQEDYAAAVGITQGTDGAKAVYGWPRLPLVGQILYLFLGGMPTVLLGAGLTFTPPLYAPYIHGQHLWGLSPETDQQLGGLLMWVPGNILFIVYVSILFIRWMQAQDEQQRIREAELYADS